MSKIKNVNKANNAGVWLGISFLVLSGIFFWKSRSMAYYIKAAPGPGFLPIWVSGILFVLSLMYIFRSLKTEIIPFSKVIPHGKGLANIIYTMGSLLLFIVITPYTGFIISCIVMLFIQFNRGYKWYWALGLSVLVTIIVYVIFALILQVKLPVNRFGF